MLALSNAGVILANYSREKQRSEEGRKKGRKEGRKEGRKDTGEIGR